MPPKRTAARGLARRRRRPAIAFGRPAEAACSRVLALKNGHASAGLACSDFGPTAGQGAWRPAHRLDAEAASRSDEARRADCGRRAASAPRRACNHVDHLDLRPALDQLARHRPARTAIRDPLRQGAAARRRAGNASAEMQPRPCADFPFGGRDEWMKASLVRRGAREHGGSGWAPPPDPPTLCRSPTSPPMEARCDACRRPTAFRRSRSSGASSRW